MRGRLALLCALFALPAAAQDLPVVPMETVLSNASPMAGLWQVSRPDVISLDDPGAPPRLGPLRDSFCRIAPRGDGLAMLCSGLEPALVSDEKDRVTFAWGPPSAQMAIVGALDDPDHFRGHFQFHFAGKDFDNPAVSRAVRITPDPQARDLGGQAERLRRILTRGFAGVPRDAAVTWPDPPALGVVRTITYVGQEAGSDAYVVAFAQGERICELHQDRDGRLDGFVCY